MATNAKKRHTALSIKAIVKDDIDKGTYTPGDHIPSVASLAKRFGVSIHTIRLAIDELAQEGVLEVSHGKRTTVAPPKLNYDPFAGFAEQCERLGKSCRTDIRHTGWAEAHRDTLRYLDMKPGTQTWHVVRVHYLEDAPVAVEFTEFSKKLAHELMDELSKLRSLVTTLRDTLHYPELAVELCSIDTTSDREIMELLGSPRRLTCYIIERRVMSAGTPLFVSYFILRNDKFRLHLSQQASVHPYD